MSEADAGADAVAVAIVSDGDGSILPVVAQPGARRNAVLGVRAGALRVAVTAPPEKGKANAAIQALLAESLGCKPSQVALASGATSRQKRFRIGGIDPDGLRRRLAESMPHSQTTGVSRGDAKNRRGANKNKTDYI
jgi:uncharacterized protein (TIGR00251 family)